MSTLPEELAAVVADQRPYILVSIVGQEIEILFGGDPAEPPTWADVATLLAYAAECASSNAEES